MIEKKTVYKYTCDVCENETDKNFNVEDKLIFKSDKDLVWYISFTPYLYIPYLDEDKRVICKECYANSLRKMAMKILGE